MSYFQGNVNIGRPQAQQQPQHQSQHALNQIQFNLSVSRHRLMWLRHATHVGSTGLFTLLCHELFTFYPKYSYGYRKFKGEVEQELKKSNINLTSQQLESLVTSQDSFKDFLTTKSKAKLQLIKDAQQDIRDSRMSLVAITVANTLGGCLQFRLFNVAANIVFSMAVVNLSSICYSLYRCKDLRVSPKMSAVYDLIAVGTLTASALVTLSSGRTLIKALRTKSIVKK